MAFRFKLMIDALRRRRYNCKPQCVDQKQTRIIAGVSHRRLRRGRESQKLCLHFFVPLTLRATLLAALRMVPLKPLPLTGFPLAGLGAEVVLFALEGGILALTGLLEGAFLAAVLRGDFVWA